MTEWLTNGYQDKRKIEEDYACKVLTKEKRDALMAVHDCDRKEATEPSAKDIEFLNKLYHSMSVYISYRYTIIMHWLLVSGKKTRTTCTCICS